MSSNKRKVRCYAEKIGKQWQAFCIDLNLAVQADTLPDVRAKLESMISSYLKLAMEQTDPQHQRDMLFRPAPIAIQLRYWYVRAALAFDNISRPRHHGRRPNHREKFELMSFRQPAFC